MASGPVQTQYLKAGADYLDALRRLGLTPKFAGWGWDRVSEQWLLVLVTSIVDAGGPLELNRLLFRAYNAKATPQQISPFIVRIFSPEIVPDNLYLAGEKNLKIANVKDKGLREPSKVENMQQTFLGIELQMINSYQNPRQGKKKPSYHERRKEWTRFRNSVERLAA